MLTKQQRYRRRLALKVRFFDELDAMIPQETAPDKLGVVQKLNGARERIEAVSDEDQS